MKELGKKLHISDELIEILIHDIDANQDGVISKQEWLQ